jgi:coatomer subunit beta'
LVNFLSKFLIIKNNSISNKQKLKELAEKAYQDGFYNISFNCYIQTNDLENCLKVLLESNQIPEACLFARTYLPSKLTETMEVWNNYLNDNNTNNRISKVFILFFINFK